MIYERFIECLDLCNNHIDEGGGNVQGIYIHKREIDAINWLRRNAFDDGTPYYFFESLNPNLDMLIHIQTDIEQSTRHNHFDSKCILLVINLLAM